MNHIFFQSLYRIINPYIHSISLFVLTFLSIGMYKNNILYGIFNIIDIAYLYYAIVKSKKHFSLLFVMLLMLARDTFYLLPYGYSNLIYLLMILLHNKMIKTNFIHSFAVFELDKKIIYLTMSVFHIILQFLLNINNSIILLIMQIVNILIITSIFESISLYFAKKKIKDISFSASIR